MRTLAFLLLLGAATPAFAQSHTDHQMPMGGDDPQAENGTPEPEEPMDHSQMDHSQMDHGAMPGMDHESMPPMDDGAMPEMDHSTMEGMDHGSMPGMGHGQQSAIGDPPEGPPPPEAFEGPTFAADEAVGADIMNSSRIQVMREVSGMPVGWFQAERLEYRSRQGSDGYLWDVQGFYGGDYDKFWFKSEGEGSFGEKPETAEIQALWSHAIGPWFDLQAGLRQDLVGPARTHLAVGVQGLAPYMFELDAAAFVSNKGDVTARLEAELDQRITQRLILQPRAELNLAAQDIPELGVGAGLDRVEAGLRLRYEFAREFAPYIGVAQEWRLGGSADYARAAGEDPSVTNFVAGIRFWF